MGHRAGEFLGRNSRSKLSMEQVLASDWPGRGWGRRRAAWGAQVTRQDQSLTLLQKSKHRLPVVSGTTPSFISSD